MDIRRLILIVIIVTFMAVTVGHVAAYAGSFEAARWQWLGWPYALGVDVAIALCAWFTRWKLTRKWAAVGYGMFVAASGVMNVAAVNPGAQTAPGAAWVYALFPTIAIALLGFLLRQVEGLGAAKKYQLELRRPAFLQKREPKAPEERKKTEPPETLHELAPSARRKQLLDIWSANGRKTFTELAGVFGVSRQTIGNDFTVLAKEGKVKRQGRHIVVN